MSIAIQSFYQFAVCRNQGIAGAPAVFSISEVISSRQNYCGDFSFDHRRISVLSTGRALLFWPQDALHTASEYMENMRPKGSEMIRYQDFESSQATKSSVE